VLLPLVPWTCRNWRTFHEIQPLAPRYATDPGELVGYGFNRWYRTWAMEYKSTEDIYWNLNDETMDINTIPTRAFDSDAQYEATRQLLDEYNDTTTETPEMDARFDAIAQQRIAANPLRYYVELPTARVIDMWLRPRTERLPLDTEWWNYGEHPLESILIAGYALLNLAYLLAAGIGAWKAWRWLSSEQRPILWAMLGFVALRTALLFTLDNAEQRYTLECFPMIFLLGGYALSCDWRRQSN